MSTTPEEAASTPTTTTEECRELKNIRYKSMLLNGTHIQDSKVSTDIDTLEEFLEKESKDNSQKTWCRLNKTLKLRKLIDYANNYCKDRYNLTEAETHQLTSFFNDCLDKKRLQKVKEVLYDKDTGEVVDIPSLQYIRPRKHFTLKHCDKRVSTLKSLAPRRET